MKMFISIFFHLAMVISSVHANAAWKEADKADVVLNYANSNVTVKENGTAVYEEERMYTSKNETGRNKLALETVPFAPELMSVQIMKAVSITQGVETPIDIKTIQTRTAADPATKQGISGIKELVIPFTNLQIGSSIKYKMLMKEKKAVFPGTFSMAFVYGLKEPELGGEVTIRSAKKLNFVVSDPEKYLEVVSGKEGKNYTLKIKMLRPFKRAIDSENIPILSYSHFPSVRVTTLESWSQFVNLFTEKYEKALAEKLPDVFEGIAAKAAIKTDVYEKIDTVTSELAAIMTYSGNWTTLDKMFFPRGHAEIAKSKIGDCKDFATSTVGMLRKLGVKANVALVVRKSPYDQFNRIQSRPLQEDFAFPSFNHLIVRVELPDGKIVWVDPTNVTSNSKVPGLDIASSQALNVSKGTTGLEFVPDANIEDSAISYEKTIRITPDERAESEGKLTATGFYASEILNNAILKDEQTAKAITLALFGSVAKDGAKANYKSRLASKFEATIKTHSEPIFKREGDTIQIFLPLPKALEMYSLGYTKSRVTDFYGVPTSKITSKVTIQGYDFDEDKEHGCWVANPWFEIERKVLKVEQGIEVRDQILMKKDHITAGEINDREFGFALGDFDTCISAQALNVTELDPAKTLADRIKTYNLEKLENLSLSSGPQIYDSARVMKVIADQILEKDPQNAEVIIYKIRAARWLAMRVGTLYGPTYLDYAQKWADVILARDESHELALIHKAYNYSFQNKQTEATQYFSKAFYASKEKGYEIYRLGGYLAERRDDYKMSSQSYLKALQFAKHDQQKAGIWRMLANNAMDIRDYKTAEDYFGRALVYRKDDPYMKNDLIILANMQKNYDKAIQIGEALLKESNFGAARSNVADAYMNKAFQAMAAGGDNGFEIAREFALKGLRWDSENYDCYEIVAQSYEVQAMKNKDASLVDRIIEIREKMIPLAKTATQKQLAQTNAQRARTLSMIINQAGRLPASQSSDKKNNLVIPPAAATSK